VANGRVVFGCRDGAVYCLDATDGRLIWRFRAAPNDTRLTAFEQIESVWPVHGSVLIMNGTVWAVAGRSMFLDGGLHWVRLDVRTGKLLQELVLDNRDPNTGKDLHSDVRWLNMPVALPDVLSSDGKFIYMRSQRFDLTGKRYEVVPKSDKAGIVASDQSGPGQHLFSPTGFLDGSWFHRSYWEYGKKFSSGWNGYYLAGKLVPAGRILCFDDSAVYGYGRKPRFYRWTTPMEYQLFAAPLNGGMSGKPPVEVKLSCVHVSNSGSLNAARKPLTVTAWIKTDRGDGVVLARGAGINGYSLYIRGGKPRFAVTSSRKAYETVGKRKVALDKWTHLAGVLRRDGRLQVYLDGDLVGERTGVPLIPKTPIEAMEIGMDAGGAAGAYQSLSGLKGVIDEVRVFHRDLSDAEVRALARQSKPGGKPPADLVLYLPFDKGEGRDTSGNGNHGRIENAKPVAGKFGRALAFTGTAPLESQRTTGYKVVHQWTLDVPILVRGMVLTGAGGAVRTLFVAGPPDLVDETQAVRRLSEVPVQKKLVQEEAALAGKGGALLWAVAADSGKKRTECRLDTPPVWDGLVAVGNRLYLCGEDGAVRCLAGR